jgi:hypothetical protein
VDPAVNVKALILSLMAAVLLLALLTSILFSKLASDVNLVKYGMGQVASIVVTMEEYGVIQI